MNRRPPLRSEFFLYPRYWPVWLLLGAMWCVARLPYSGQLFIGRQLGRLLYRALRERRTVARINLQLCFPDMGARDREALLRRHFAALGMGAVEIAACWWTPDAQLRPLTAVEGLEHLHEALAQGKGAILLTAHFTTTEIGARLLQLFFTCHASYRNHNNPLFDAVMHRAREAHCETVIARGDVRAFLGSLKHNVPVWYAPDQNHGPRHNIVFAPFFGVPAATITATSRLAQISGAPVIPFFPQRLPGAAGYRLRLLPPLTDFPSGDAERDTRRVNALIEAAVREVPEQYLWVHRRFKTRPAGEPYPYPPRRKKPRAATATPQT